MYNNILECTFILLLCSLYFLILCSNVIFWFIFNLIFNIVILVTIIIITFLFLMVLLRLRRLYFKDGLINGWWFFFLNISKLSLNLSLSCYLCTLHYCSSSIWCVLLMKINRICSTSKLIYFLCTAITYWLILLIAIDLLIRLWLLE